MIGYIAGEILERHFEKTDSHWVVIVGTREAGVGYTVSVPNQPSYQEKAQGQPVRVYIYAHIREEAFDLYGFLTLAEKQFFEGLLSVNGIGPRGAMGLMSGASIGTLAQWIVSGEREQLTRIQGVGKKTAERLILELADGLKKRMEAGDFGSVEAQASPHAWSGVGDAVTGGLINEMREAKEALLALGYRESAIEGVLRKVRLVDASTHAKGTEALVRSALKELN
jgi:Holliday junction DNA helicase RuvA